MKKILSLLSILLLCSACVDKSLYEPDPNTPTPGTTPDKTFYENVDFAASFATRHVLTINKITSSIMPIHFSYPYTQTKDGEQVLRNADAVLYTAGEYQLEVPKHVADIYYWNGRSFTKTSVKGKTSISLPEGTRGYADLENGVLDLITNTYFPEKTASRTKADIQSCCDLVIKSEEEGKQLDKVTVTLTYIGNGNSELNSWLMLYTYPTEKRSTLTLDDVTFYGFTSGGFLKMNEAATGNNTVEKKTFGPLNDKDQGYAKAGIWDKVKGKSILNSPTSINGNLGNENSGIKFTADITLTHVNFKEGVSIGFCYIPTTGKGEVGFSTPELNPRVTGTVQTSEGDVEFNDELQCRCLVYHFAHGGKEYNILGCESRNPGTTYYDGDYNDLLVMVETDPSYIKPAERINPPEQDSYQLVEGYWLFEDLYPDFEQNDYDYNDVVVKYLAKKSLDKDETLLTCTLVAKGCQQSNAFGVNGETIFSGIQGYQNVYADQPVNTNGLSQASLTLSTKELKPWIQPNGKDKLVAGTYAEGMQFPYVLDVPIDFPGWCIERTPIKTAYPTFPTNDNWYIQAEGGKVISMQ